MASQGSCIEFSRTNVAERAALEGLIHAWQVEEDLRVSGSAEDNVIFATRVRETLEQILANKTNSFLLHREDGEFEGYIHFRRDVIQRIIWIESVYVAEQHRQRGVGSALVAALESLAAVEGFTRIRAYAPRTDIRAQSNYKKAGYRVARTQYVGFEKQLVPGAAISTRQS